MKHVQQSDDTMRTLMLRGDKVVLAPEQDVNGDYPITVSVSEEWDLQPLARFLKDGYGLRGIEMDQVMRTMDDIIKMRVLRDIFD